jgi:hypothetical protein
MTIRLKVNSDVIVLGCMVEMLNARRNALDRQTLQRRKVSHNLRKSTTEEVLTSARYLVEAPLA